MGTPSISLDPAEISQSGSTSTEPISLDANEVSGGQSNGPVNPYAGNGMEHVAGAVPGMPSPMQVAAQGVHHASSDRAIEPIGAYAALSHDAPRTGAQTYSGRQKFADEQQAQDQGGIEMTEKMFGIKPGDVADTAMRKDVEQRNAQTAAHPVESYLQSADPVLGSIVTGAYETGAGLKDVAKGAVDRSGKELLRGSTRTIGGAMTAGTPEFGLAAWQAPVKTAAYYFAGVKAGEAAKVVAQKLNMSPEAQEFANTVGFFIPVAFHTVTQLSAEAGTRMARVPDPATGGTKEVNVNTAAVGGRGFGIGVGKGEDGSYYAAGRVGPFSARARWGGQPEVAPAAPGEARGPIAGRLAAESENPTANLGRPVEAPDGSTVVAQQQAATVAQAAARAQASESLAGSVAGTNPPPPPPPKPGEPGSKQTPAPAGMDDGHLSPEAAGMLAKAVNMLPPKLQPQAILESVGTLTKWIRGKGTIVGPDGKIHAVTGQSPAAQDQSAHTIAVKITNDAIEAHQAGQEDAAKQQQEQAETVQKEHEAALQGASVTGTSPAKGEEAPAVPIPNTPPVRKAIEALRQAPPNATAADMDKVIRSTAMVTTPVRKALVEAEVSRRANSKEEAAETAMNGKPPEPGRSREELQRWSDAVIKGDHPFVHIPQDSNFVPSGIENAVSSGDMVRTKVKGAGAFSGTYYHSSDVSAADIRKAARDKKDPQAALDKITAEFAGKQSPVELQTEEVGQSSSTVSSEVSPVEQHGNRQESESDAIDKELKTLQPEIDEESKEPESKPIHPEVHKGLADIVEEHAAADPTATLDSVLSDPQDGKIIAKALVNDGIITNSAMNPETAILTTKTRKALTNSVVGEVFGDALMKRTPEFIREKLSGILGTWGIIHGKQDQWSLQKPMLSAIDLFNRAYRSEDVDTSNPVADALMKKLDGPIDELRKAISNYAVVADSNRDNYAPEGEADKPYLAFNIAFGTELTEEQYQKAIDNLNAPRAAAAPPPQAAAPASIEDAPTSAAAPIVVGDEVSYTTNKGKTRKGVVKWTDGKKVRIQDGASQVTKNADEVQGPAAEKHPKAKPVEEQSAPVATDKVEVSADRTLVDHVAAAIEDGNGPRNYNELQRLVAQFDGHQPNQLRMKEAQEAFEAAQNRVAARIATSNRTTQGKFEWMVHMYENQPNLAIRTSTSVQNQAYSTPIPLAFIADKFAGIDGSTSVYEPTAGTGNLLIGANPANVQANELNQFRADILKAEGFDVTTKDATTWAPTERFDAVVANPPFAKLPGPVKIDGYNIVKLEHLIVAKALGAMKDDGKASFIIAAGDRERPGFITNEQMPFWNWLYSHYNVVSDFEVNGDLYSRQGASYPVRTVAIDGRVASAKVSPMPDTIKRLNTWGEIYEHASQHLGSDLAGQRRADNELGNRQRPEAAKSGDVSRVSAGGDGGTDLSQPGEGAQSDGGIERPENQPRPVRHTGSVPDPRVGSADITVRSDGDVAESNRLAEGQSAPKPVRRESPKPDGHSADAIKIVSNEHQTSYVPFSEKKDVGVMAPKALLAPMHAALERIADDVGDIDEWMAGELGYDSVEDMHSAFMGTQVDGAAAAIHNIGKGKAIIIADQTGLGKGRQAAAIIRWAELHGHIPVFMTAGDNLFSDMYRDLQDIGAATAVQPLIFNKDGVIKDSVTEEVMYKNRSAMRPIFERMMETGELPPGNNSIFLTYSQISADSNRQQMVLQRIAERSIFILDESHEAAGAESNRGLFLQGLLANSKGVMFLSATWAKRPDNLALYAPKTDLSIAIPDQAKIVDAFSKGGVPLQTVLTYQLAEAGQYVRRERSFDGIAFPTYEDIEHQKEHEKLCDDVTECLRAILMADRAFHNHDFERIQAEMRKQGKSSGSKTIVTHMEFSSTVHNLVKQLLLALKSDLAADEMITAIKNGEKPLLALENTMGSFLQSYVESHGLSEGDLLHGMNYSKLLDRALMRTRYYLETNDMGEKRRVEVPLHMLEKSLPFYKEAQALIDKLTVDLPVSPIDHIRNKIEQAGYSVAEITGRDLRIDYSGETPKLSRRPASEMKDRVGTASGFNNGRIHAIILNRAGSTGISLHASPKFRDQSPRRMIVIQPAGDINTVMQMLGRINRTGQVKLPLYSLLAVALPAEQRPAIVLSKKMKSLNANTSSNTKSATSIKAVDLLNKYGDEVVGRYLLDNPDMRDVLGLDVAEGKEGDIQAEPGLAMKATGRSALLPVKEQKAFMDSVSDAYTSYIEFLTETGQNDLEPQTYDYDARETHIQRIYQGTDYSSPFGQDAFYGEYSIRRQGTPITPKEVREMLDETLGPELAKLPPQKSIWMYQQDVDKHFKGLYEEFFKGVKSEASAKRAETLREVGSALLRDFPVGAAMRVSVNGDTYNGMVVRIDGSKKQTGNPYAPSSLQFTIAVNGTLRKLKVPGTQIRGMMVSHLGSRQDIDSLFKDHIGDRQKAKILTGNLLGAYGTLKDNIRGRVITFTTADGTVKQGILMPQDFDVDEDVEEKYAMRTPEGAYAYLKGGDHYLMADAGDVGIWGPGQKQDGYQIRTKTSRAAGGKYFMDAQLRSMIVGGEFASSGGMMKAYVLQGQEVNALARIMQMTGLYPTQHGIEEARSQDEKITQNKNPEPPKNSPAARRLRSTDPTATMSFMGAGYAAKGAQELAEFAKKAGPATLEDVLKAAKLAGRTMKQAGREVVATLYPRALADEEAKDIMGRGIGKPALTMFRAGHLMDGISNMFTGMTAEDQLEFVDRWQKGKEQPTPELRDAQELMQSIMDGQRAEENEAVNLGRKGKERINLSDRTHYFPNRYKVYPNGDTPLTDTERVARIASRRPFEGSKAFLKQQKTTLKEAVAKGAEPLGTPVDMVMRRLQEGAKFVAAKYVMHALKEAGMVTFLKQGKKMPAGYVRIEDKIAKVWRPFETEEGGVYFKQTGEWVGQEDALRLLNNYLSKDYIRASTVGASLVALKNATTEIRLSWSPFHWGYITVETWASGLNIGLDRLYNQGLRNLDGQAAIEGLADLGKTMVAPWTAIKTGNNMIRFAQNPDEFLATPEGQHFAEVYPDFPHLQELLFSGGLRWGMADNYKVSLGDGFTKSIAEGHLGAATLKFFPWLSHVMMKPLFEHYIPRAKWTFAAQILSAKLNQYAYAIASGEMTEEQIARDVVSATENRFGEMNFDNLYWNNTFRTANQLMFRSVSWKAGTWLGLVKAGKESFTSQAFNDHAYERVFDGSNPGDWARKYTSKLPQMGINTGWLISMGLVSAVIASVTTWMATKTPLWKHAEEDHNKLRMPYLGALAFECLHPRTGRVDAHGEPIRISLPTGLKDYEHAYLTPKRYMKGSLADWAGTTWDTLENRDAFDNYVYNPNAPVFTEFKQGLAYNLKGEFLPMSVSNLRNDFGPQDFGSKVARATGLLGSPKELDRSHALNEALEMRPPHTPETPEQLEESKEKKAHPTHEMIRRAAREKNLSYLQRVVLHDLNYVQAKEIYDDPKTTDQERRELGPIIARKRENMIRLATRR